jgi:cytoskeletal protein CcmA (bactofilin family)
MKRLLAFFGLGDDGSGPDTPAVAPPSTTTIGTGITIKGELRGEGPLTMLGQFEGDIVLDGTLHVGPDARVDANISAHAIVVAGVVRGNLSADTRVEILPTGALTGTVKSAAFTAADGATVTGEIWVARAAPPEARA